jgi:hypothetical protein
MTTNPSNELDEIRAILRLSAERQAQAQEQHDRDMAELRQTDIQQQQLIVQQQQAFLEHQQAMLELRQIVESNSRAIVANSEAMSDLRQDLRASIADTVAMVGTLANQQSEIAAEVRGLQLESRRILDYLLNQQNGENTP